MTQMTQVADVISAEAEAEAMRQGGRSSFILNALPNDITLIWGNKAAMNWLSLKRKSQADPQLQSMCT